MNGAIFTMNPAAIPVPDPNEPAAPVAETPATAAPADEAAHPDPITGEPGAHPVGTGIGALGAGMAGAAIGALGGPIGVLIGAAVGAVAGGLAGHEVAASTPDSVTATDEVAATTDDPVVTDTTANLGAPVTAMETPGGLGANVPGFGAAALAMHGGFGGEPRSEKPFKSEYDTEVEVESNVPLEGDSSRETGSYFTATGATGLEAPRPVEESDLVAPSGAGDEHAVRLSAYYHYLDRCDTGEPGDALSDWLSAEQEVAV